MYYVYVLMGRNKRLYTGYTSDLRRRLKEHNSHKGGDYSKKNGPYMLIFYEAYLEKDDAIKQELFYKSGYGREVLNGKIGGSLSKLRV